MENLEKRTHTHLDILFPICFESAKNFYIKATEKNGASFSFRDTMILTQVFFKCTSP